MRYIDRNYERVGGFKKIIPLELESSVLEDQSAEPSVNSLLQNRLKAAVKFLLRDHKCGSSGFLLEQVSPPASVEESFSS